MRILAVKHSRGRAIERPKEIKLHAVVVRVTINNREAAQQNLRDQVVPRVSQAPGFVHGYWTWKDNTGLAMVVFESEAEATPYEPAGPEHDHPRRHP
jgi:hypothetical protein